MQNKIDLLPNDKINWYNKYPNHLHPTVKKTNILKTRHQNHKPHRKLGNARVYENHETSRNENQGPWYN